MNDVFIVAIAAAAWCAVHSLLIAPCCEAWLERRRPGLAAWHRLLYNLVAAATLIPLWLLFRDLPGEPLWRWHGGWQALRAGLLLWFLVLGWLGSLAHDGRAFLGLRRIRDARADRPPAPPSLSRAGVLGAVRHPWYGAGIALVIAWSDFTTTNVAWRAVFVLYLLVGARIEDRRLARRFGPEFARYRREVPAFLPRPRRRR